MWYGAALVVCGAQLSQQWYGACLIYTLKVVYSTLLGLLISLGTPDGKWGICSGAYVWYMAVLLARHDCFDHVYRYLRCASLPVISALT